MKFVNEQRQMKEHWWISRYEFSKKKVFLRINDTMLYNLEETIIVLFYFLNLFYYLNLFYFFFLTRYDHF